MLIDYRRLQRLMGAGTYDELRSSLRGWVEEYLGGGAKNDDIGLENAYFWQVNKE